MKFARLYLFETILGLMMLLYFIVVLVFGPKSFGESSAVSQIVIEGEAKFLATGTPGFIEIEGAGAKLINADLARDIDGTITGEISVDLTGLDTGMDLRDTHMKEKYLETGIHPKATLVVTKAIGTTFDGMLTIKKDTKPVSGTWGIVGQTLKAKFVIKMSDFPSIGVPSWLGVTVADTVEINVNGSVK